jgi:hypothetical protein
VEWKKLIFEMKIRGKLRISPMESCEKSSLRLLDEALYPSLKPKPLELAGDELVASHRWLNAFLPFRIDQRPTACLD